MEKTRIQQRREELGWSKQKLAWVATREAWTEWYRHRKPAGRPPMTTTMREV